MKYLAFLIIEFATTIILETFEIILIMECDKITMRLLRLWSYRLNILRFKAKVIYFWYLLPGSATYLGLGVVVSKLFYFWIQKCLQLLELVKTCLNWSKVVQIGQWLFKFGQNLLKLVITYPNMIKFSHAACIGLKVFWDLYSTCKSTIVITLRCHYLIDNDNQLIFW